MLGHRKTRKGHRAGDHTSFSALREVTKPPSPRAGVQPRPGDSSEGCQGVRGGGSPSGSALSLQIGNEAP